MAVPRYAPRVMLRAVLRTAAMATVAGVPAAAHAAAVIALRGSMVAAWHTTIAPRWHGRQQHDGSATPDGLLAPRQNTLIKNHKYRTHHCTVGHGPL